MPLSGVISKTACRSVRHRLYQSRHRDATSRTQEGGKGLLSTRWAVQSHKKEVLMGSLVGARPRNDDQCPNYYTSSVQQHVYLP